MSEPSDCTFVSCEVTPTFKNVPYEGIPSFFCQPPSANLGEKKGILFSSQEADIHKFYEMCITGEDEYVHAHINDDYVNPTVINNAVKYACRYLKKSVIDILLVKLEPTDIMQHAITDFYYLNMLKQVRWIYTNYEQHMGFLYWLAKEGRDDGIDKWINDLPEDDMPSPTP